MTDVDDDPSLGPHTCVYVETDDGDRCEVCGERGLDEADELGAEWDVEDAEEPLHLQLPDYDYQGGG